MCEHRNLVRLNTGWYCPECKMLFPEKPEPPKEEPKKAKKGTAK